MKIVLLGLIIISLGFLLTSCKEDSKMEKVKEKVKVKKTKPPVSTERIMNEFDRDVFYYDRIKYDGQADMIFKRFLEEIEEKRMMPNRRFRISDIESFVPKELVEIQDQDVYDYYVLLMLSGQIQRDYFLFTDKDLRTEFTAISNDPNRDNGIWRKEYSEQTFTINPKYIIR